MEVNELIVSGDASRETTPVIKPTSEITKIMSNEFLKIFELKEYCNFVESDVKKWYKKVQELTSAKNENGKIISEYKNRNKINLINSESLLQSLNELYKYKCELKFNYIAAEKAMKIKKIKYKKVVSSYESSWEKAVKEYNSDPVFAQLHEIQEENSLLEKDIEKQKELNTRTETEFVELKANIKKNLAESIIEFSKAMLQYKQFVTSTSRNETEFNDIKNSKGKFKLFQGNKPSCGQNNLIDGHNNVNYTYTIDVSVFDDITVPSENLESQNSEEGYSFVQNDGQQINETSKEEVLEYLNNYQQAPQSKTIEKDEKDEKGGEEENESEYFRPQESLKQPSNEQWSSSKEKGNTVEESKSRNNTNRPQEQEIEEEPSKDIPEYDESLGEGSYEKQIGDQKEIWQKTSSVSSDDFPPAGQNQNENAQPGNKTFDQNNFFKPTADTGKNDFQSFSGFFMMGNDQDTPKPSIFKLF